MNNSAKTLN